MADIELVIKIPEKEFGMEISDKFQDFFKRLKVEIKEHLISGTKLVCGAYELETIEMFLNAFVNAIPLSKGHGDLKDANNLKHAFISWSMAVQGFFTDADIASIIYNSPTIIEADKESEEV